MSDRRPTDLEIAIALRAHLPAAARADLRERVAVVVAETRQQRAFPSLAGALTDADPIVRRRSILIAAALLAVALAASLAAGTLRLSQRSDDLPGAHGLVAFVRRDDVFVAAADGGEAHLVAHVDGAGLSQPRWSADRRWLAVQTEEPAILGIDMRSGAVRRLAAGQLGEWSPVSSTLAYYTPEGQVALLDADGGEPRVLVRPPSPDHRYPGYGAVLAWSRDGRQLALPDAGEGALLRVDVATGDVTTVASLGCCLANASWSPDDSRIAYSLWFERNVPPRFWIVGADGSGSIEVGDPDTIAQEPTFSPDGAWIAYRTWRWEGESRIDRVMVVRPDGSDPRVLATLGIGSKQNEVDLVGWSGDGASIAFTVGIDDGAGERRELHLVRLADGSDRILPAATDGDDVAWTEPLTDGQGRTDLVVPSPSTLASEVPAVAPASGEPAELDASWGALAYRVQQGESDCFVAVMRFPTTVTYNPPPDGPPPTDAPPASTPGPGATPGPQPAGEYCEFGFAPGGAAYSITSQAHQSFTIIGADGTVLAGPFPWHDVPTWSPGGTWFATTRCAPPSACDPADSMIMRRDGSDPHELPGRPSWSPDEQVLAVQGEDGQLLVGHGDGTGLQPIGTFPLPAGWAQDGSEFVFVRDGNAWVTRADGSDVRNLTGFDLGGVAGAWWSPDGRWIAVLQGTTMWIFSPDGSVRQRIGSGLGPGDGGWGAPWSPAWSPDGTWLAIEHPDRTSPVGSQTTDISLVHAGDWRTVRLANAFQPAWSLDGRHLAYVSEGYVVNVVNADGTGHRGVAGTPYPPVWWMR